MYKSEVNNKNANIAQVGTDNAKALFVSASVFQDIKDLEIVSVFGAWLSNDVFYEDYVFNKFVLTTLKLKPCDFVMKYSNEYEKKGKASFFRFLTYEHLHNLIYKLKEIESHKNGFMGFYKDNISQQKKTDKYAHDTLARIFGQNTGFQSQKSNGTFFRFNLLLYWLTYKLKVWDIGISNNALIPCNDKIFAKATDMGFFKHLPRTTLENAIYLTDIARRNYGDDEFYKLYEILLVS